MNVGLRKTNRLDRQSRDLKQLNPTISRNWSGIAALGVLSSVLLTANPVRAAEKIFLTYGPLQLSVKVSSLETFAKEGKIEKDLEFYLGKASQEQQAQFRKALLERADVSPVLLSRFFYTQIGEDILTRLGNIITQERGINGNRGLRATLVLAAFDPEGLTLLNFFKKFPTNMQFQGELMLGLAGAVEKVVKATEVFTNEIKQLSSQEMASAPSTDFSKLPDLRQPGTFEVQPKQTWVLKDSSRDRKFYVDVYKPQKWHSGKAPVVIFSHGLASRPEDFAKRAQHLASYGYVVALPQHPGSDTKQAEALLKGYSREIFDLNEFINRPKDISYTIDELERRNQSEFQGQLDLESVGVAGHSLGGYTALAVAGAEIDFQNLEKDCKRQFGGLDTSLLLQCRALTLPRQTYNLRDRRVSAVFTENPVNSSIFGSMGLSKIQIPVFIAGGNYDPATPFVFEQVRVFPWLTTSNKYLAMSEGQAHVDFSQLDAGVQTTIESVGNFTLPSPNLIASYTNSVSLAFFGAYIEKRKDYKLYLQSSYAAYLSQDEKFKLSLISAASSDKLNQALDSFKRKYNVSP
jgi:predicted dienelactone hydrolase